MTVLLAKNGAPTRGRSTPILRIHLELGEDQNAAKKKRGEEERGREGGIPDQEKNSKERET